MTKLFLPHQYQFVAIAAIIAKRFLAVFLDPGLGKTAIILRAYMTLKKQRKASSMLVIAPLRVCYSVWPKEPRKWSFSRHMKVRVLHGPNKVWELSQPADIYVINPEGLKWLFTAALKGKRKYPFDMLVVDESSKFKNHASKNLAILYKKLNKFRRRYILNGTPAPKGYIDLFGQFLIVDRGVALGRYITHFREDYLIADFMGHNWSIRNDKCAEEIQQKLAPISLVMESKDYLDMPPLTFPIRSVVLPPKAMRHYQEAERELFTEIMVDDKLIELDIKNIAVATGMCRQLTAGAFYEPLELEELETPPNSKDRVWHELHDAKIESLMGLIDELQGKPLLIAYEYYHSYVRIVAAIKKRFKIEVRAINSDTTPQMGVKIENAWNAGELRVLLGHSASIQYGLNLQESGDDIVWFDLTWSLDKFIQYIRRLHRQGKTRPVRVHQIVAENTIEKLMLRRLKDRHIVEKEFKAAIKYYKLQSERHLTKHNT